jgi:OOP family OmpA-OmpF porin
MNKTALAALLAAFIATPVEAGDMYAGIKLGKSRHNISGVINTPTALGIFGGYKINPDFAIEAGYIDLGNFGSNKATAADVSALFFYPGDEPFSMYAKISYASSAWKVPGQVQYNSSFTPGLGLNYDTSQSTSFRFAWDRYMIGNPDVANIDVLNFAGIFRF